MILVMNVSKTQICKRIVELISSTCLMRLRRESDPVRVTRPYAREMFQHVLRSALLPSPLIPFPVIFQKTWKSRRLPAVEVDSG